MNMVYNKKERVLQINHDTKSNNLLNRQLLLRYTLGKYMYLPSDRLKDLQNKIKHMYKIYLRIKSLTEYTKGKNFSINKNLIINYSLKNSKENENFKESYIDLRLI